jgi:hypothetical protein
MEYAPLVSLQKYGGEGGFFYRHFSQVPMNRSMFPLSGCHLPLATVFGQVPVEAGRIL